jgi:transposase, IS5 family
MQGLFGEILIKPKRKRAGGHNYVSPNQMILEGFESPFQQQLSKTNRWVMLSDKIPWDRVVQFYDKTFKSEEGRPPINGRVVIGSVIIKHMLKLSDRETIQQVKENMFMQYFLGYSTFTNEEPFNHTLFVNIREKLSLDVMSQISEIVLKYHNFISEEIEIKNEELADSENDESNDDDQNICIENSESIESEDIVIQEKAENKIPNKGKLLMDATVPPQNITFPTDLKLLNSSRKKSEELIDKLYRSDLHGEKPRTYRRIALKEFLNTNKKKRKTSKEIYKSNGVQIRYLKRNINHIVSMLEAYDKAGDNVYMPLKSKDLVYLVTIQKVLEQQSEMHLNNTHSVEDRIVNIHQPHVRPIVRGKEGVKVEFGSKIHISLVLGFTFIDSLKWDNYNESTSLIDSVEKYKKKFGFYPVEVLADQIYCTRANRIYLKKRDIILHGKPLGRPPKVKALSIPVSPGERNPVEGKFGQAKVGYGMNLIKAKLKSTSESWIGAIVLVLNLVNLTRLALLRLIEHIVFCNNVSKIRFAGV